MAITRERLQELRKQMEEDDASSAVRANRNNPSSHSAAASGTARTRRTSTSARRAEEDKEPGGLLDSLMGMMQRSTELQNQTAYRNQEIEKEGGKLAGRLAAQVLDTTPREGSLADRMERNARGVMDEQESRWREYNEWLEEGSNRELAAAVERMEDSGGQYSLADLAANNDRGWTMEQIEDAAARLADRGLLDKAYSVNRRAGKSVAGIGQEAAGAAAMALPVAAQAVEDVLYGTETRPEEIDGLAGDLYRWGSNVYQRGGENLQESRLGLSDLEELAYGAAESAGENIALGLINPGLLLAEQTARSAGGGIADMAAAGRSAGAAALSGLGHGAISAGIEQIGIGQMMRNMGMRTGMSRAADSILDRIAALPGLDRLAPAVAGTVANAGEEAAEEFVQTYADTALDTVLGAPDTPGLLSGELLGEAAQSALGGAAGGALIGGISTGIGAAQDVRQGRIAPRADLMANAQLSAAVEQAGQMGQAAQTAAAQAQQAQSQTQPLAQQQAAGQQRTAPDGGGQAAPAQRAVDPQLAELAAQSGGRLDANAWQAMQAQQGDVAGRVAGEGNAATAQADAEAAARNAAREQYQAARHDERMAARQSWTDEQRDMGLLLEGNTGMSEAAVNTAVEAMPDGVSGEVYSAAANTVYQLSRQGIAEDADEALALAGRSGVRVNQVLAAPGGEEALRMIYNRGKMDGLAASGYGAAGLADEAKAGQVQYEAGALIPEEDRALFDLYAAASDTAVTVSEKLEKNAGGYVDTALGKVYFGTQADADTFGTILHESVHQYNAWDEAGGRELQTATLRYMAEQSGFESVNDLVESYIQRYQEAGQELSYAQACEEITADAMRGVFGSEEAFGRWVEHQRALAEQNGKQRSAVARVMDKVRGMLDKVIEKAKSILAREPDNAAARQAQALAESQKRVLEDLYYKHAEAAAAARRAAREGKTESETFNNQSVESEESVAGDAESAESAAESAEFGEESSAAERREDARRYQLPVDERAMESGQRAAAWENADRAGLAEYLSELYQSGEVRRVPVERVQRLARRILTDSASKANEITVAKQLDGLMQYMASGQADFETALGAAEGIADGVLQKSTRRDSSLWNEYKDLHYFTVHMERGGPEYQEMAYQYGSYALAQKELGRNGIKLTTAKDSSARGIDQLYQELSNEYPGLFPSEITGAADQLDRIAQVRQSIRPEIKNNFGESYEEARADLAMQIIGAAVSEGVTDQGVAGMLRQRIDENLNLHRSGIQRRVVNALNQQAREARNEGFAQAQRIVRASGEANRQRLEKERAAWANTSNAMQTAMARSRNAAQRARDARSKDSTRRVIASNLSKLNRMLLHPSDQYHVPQKLLQDAIQVAELGNSATYNKETLNKLHALKSRLDEQAKASDGADSIAADWENSGISQMLASLTSNMERRQSARLAEQADAQTRRAERGLDTMYEMQSDYMAGLEMESFSLDDLMALRDLTSAMVTVIQNSNKLLATRTAQSASEFGDVAKQEVESSPSRLKDGSGRLAELYNKYRANVYNAERFFNMLGGHRHGGAMEALGKALAAGEARQTEIREKGMQQFRDVLEGEENQKLLRRFAGQDAELIDVGLSTKINRAQMVSLYMHLQNAQNRDHVLKGGVVIPNMKEYAKGHIEKAYRTNRAERITGGTIAAIEKELTTGEMADYCQKWIADLKELLNNYTKGVINETSRRLSGYDKAKVEEYYPLAVSRDVLQKEIEGVVHNGTIEGRGFLKERRERSTAPVLLEEASSVMGRTLADAAAYAGLAPAIRDANKILNANHSEQGSLWEAVRKNFGDDGVKFVEDYLTDLQQQPRARKNIFDFLSGLRGRYAGAVLTLNPGVALGQISGVPTAASELGWGPTMKAMADMLTPKSKEKMEAIRKEMTDHGYWQLEATLSNGPTAELNAVRRKPGAVQRLLEKVPGTNWLEDMDTKTRMAIWEGSKDYVDRHLEEFNLPADARGSDAWWDAVVAKMTETNDRTQPNYTISQQAAIQRDPGQLAKTLTMFKTQGFQNYGILASAIEDYRAQGVYEQEYARQAADSSLSAEERQQAQANLEQVRAARQTAGHRLQLAVTSQVVQSMVFVVAKMAVDDWLLHRYDREKDEEGQVTPASVAQRFVGMTAENIAGNALGLSELIAVAGTLLGQDGGDPVSLTGIDAINDLSSDLLRLTQAVQADEIDPAKVWERVYDLAGSLGNVAGLPIARLQRWWEGASGWYNDIAAAANSDGLTLGDVINAPPSSASQYDRLYTDVFEEADAEDAAKALERLADLDALDPPAKASNAKAADGKVLGELLSREREYGTRVESAAAARVAGNESEQRRLRQELVDVLAGALGISKTDKADARRLRTVIDKVDAAITSEVKAQMGADSATGATVYTPLLTAIEDGGDVKNIQAGLRRAGVDDGAIKSAVVNVYKDEYIYGDESSRQRIEQQLLKLNDAYGEPYFTKTKDQDDFADWVTDWELQGMNENVYTDLDEALATGNQAAAQEQINRYMEAGKSASSICTQITNLYKKEYLAADDARRQEIAQFIMRLHGTKGERFITADTLYSWVLEDAKAKAMAGR